LLADLNFLREREKQILHYDDPFRALSGCVSTAVVQCCIQIHRFQNEHVGLNGRQSGKRALAKLKRRPLQYVSLGDGMDPIKTSAWIEIVLGIVLVLVSLLWCYVVPHASLTYLYWIVVALGIIVIIVAALALAIKPKPKPQQ
jgi:hypothetical protein